jgi:hypothetical protein
MRLVPPFFLLPDTTAEDCETDLRFEGPGSSSSSSSESSERSDSSDKEEVGDGGLYGAAVGFVGVLSLTDSVDLPLVSVGPIGWPFAVGIEVPRAGRKGKSGEKRCIALPRAEDETDTNAGSSCERIDESDENAEGGNFLFIAEEDGGGREIALSNSKSP